MNTTRELYKEKSHSASKCLEDSAGYACNSTTNISVISTDVAAGPDDEMKLSSLVPPFLKKGGRVQRLGRLGKRRDGEKDKRTATGNNGGCNSGGCNSGGFSLNGDGENSNEEDDDDVWGSDCADAAMETNRDIEALRRRQENRGYLEGLTKGKAEGLQNGFDIGYPTGSQLGGLVGEVVAELLWRESIGQIDSSTRLQAMEDLRISNVLSAEYFDVNFNIDNVREHPLIAKWLRYFNGLDRQNA
ncbi:unnamed protein product [Pichia kudriavzevii]